MQGATPSVNGQECFPFSPTDDTEVESPETVNLIASSPDVPVLFPDGGDQATINIVDNGMVIRDVPFTSEVVLTCRSRNDFRGRSRMGGGGGGGLRYALTRIDLTWCP